MTKPLARHDANEPRRRQGVRAARHVRVSTRSSDRSPTEHQAGITTSRDLRAFDRSLIRGAGLRFPSLSNRGGIDAATSMLAGGPAAMSTEPQTQRHRSTRQRALPWVRKPGRVPIKRWAVPLEGSRPRAGDEPVEPAVRDPPRRADARRACRLRHADRWRPVRRSGGRAVRDRRRHRLRCRPRRDRPDGRDARPPTSSPRPRGDRRRRADRLRASPAGRPRGRPGRDRSGAAGVGRGGRGSTGRSTSSGRWAVATTSSRSSGTRPVRSSSCSTPVRGAWARRSATSSTSGRSRRTGPGSAALPHDGACVPAGRHGRLRRLLVGDDVRAPVRRGEPVADARRRRRPPSRRTRASGGSSGWWTSTTTTRPGRTTSVRTASSTARAPCAPAPARRC